MYSALFNTEYKWTVCKKNTTEGIKGNFLLSIRFVGCFWQRAVLCHKVLQTLRVLWPHHLCGCLIDKNTQTNLNYVFEYFLFMLFQNNWLSGLSIAIMWKQSRPVITTPYKCNLGQRPPCKSFLEFSWISESVRPWGGFGWM